MKKYMDLDEDVIYTTDDLKAMYNQMREDEEIEEETFEDWLDVSLDDGGFLKEV